MRLTRQIAAAAFLAVAFAGPAPAAESNWPAIREALFAERELADGAAVLALETPVRAEDAAVVPVTVRALIPQTPARHIKTIHLIIDQNPAPVAAAAKATSIRMGIVRTRVPSCCYRPAVAPAPRVRRAWPPCDR